MVVRFEKVNYAGVSTNNYALDEIEYFKNGGILQYVLRDLAA